MTGPVAAKKAAMEAAVSLAEDVSFGRLDVATLERQAADECRALFSTVIGPGDALWELQCDVMRQCVALGGMSWQEHAEWAAVLRPPEQAEPAASWIEQVLAEGAGADDDEDECDGDA